MRICYVLSEYFRWGQFGGYGTITRAVAEGLSRRGHEVFALVPKRTPQAKREQRDVETIEGVTVVGLPHSYTQRMNRSDLYRFPEADIFVNIDARFDSWAAQWFNPAARHCIWFIDPMDFPTFHQRHHKDPKSQSHLAKLKEWAIFRGLAAFGKRAAKNADAMFVQANFVRDAVERIFHSSANLPVLPNCVDIPVGPITRSSDPLVLYLGRFDWQKQPRRFIELARKCPEIRFVMAGQASDENDDREIRREAESLPNLELPGIVEGAAKDALLRQAWILCNTSLREGLPRTFQEALAYRTPILAAVDPESLVSRFGHCVVDQDFEVGLRSLLARQDLDLLGEQGQDFVRQAYGTEIVLNKHEAMYQAVLDET